MHIQALHKVWIYVADIFDLCTLGTWASALHPNILICERFYLTKARMEFFFEVQNLVKDCPGMQRMEHSFFNMYAIMGQ